MKEMVYDDGEIKGWIYNRLDTDKYYLYVAEEGKRWRKSLKTNNLINAKMKVHNIITSYKNGVYDVPQFKDIATDFLKTVKSKTRQGFHRDRLRAVFIPYFDKQKITEITTKSIEGLIEQRLQQVKPQSVNKELSTLTQVLKYAKKKSYIKEMPQIEKQKETEAKRDAFTDLELDEILTTAQQRIDDTNNRKIKYDRTMLHCFISFLTATGIRQGEALSIKFKGISDDTALLTSSKTKVRDIFLNDEAKHIIKELKETYNHYNIEFNDDDFIFLNYQGKPTKSFKKSFNELLKKTTMAKTIGKNELTLYSFRHTFITNAIKKNVPLTTIAIQCGTSLEMIQKNYNHLTIHLVKNDLK